MSSTEKDALYRTESVIQISSSNLVLTSINLTFPCLPAHLFISPVWSLLLEWNKRYLHAFALIFFGKFIVIVITESL